MELRLHYLPSLFIYLFIIFVNCFREVLFSTLWDCVYLDSEKKSIFLYSLEQYILNDQLTEIPPAILQQFVMCYKQSAKYQVIIFIINYY